MTSQNGAICGKSRGVARRVAAGWLLLGLLMGVAGCALPAGPFDNDFAAFGGAWQRGDPTWGRVGSVFQPTGETVMPPESGEPTEVGEPAVADPSILRPPGVPQPRDQDAPPDWESLLD